MSLTGPYLVKLASSVSFSEVMNQEELKIMVTAASGRTSVMYLLKEQKSNNFFSVTYSADPLENKVYILISSDAVRPCMWLR